MGFISLRAQLQIVSGFVDPTLKPTSVENCEYIWDNSTYVAQMTTTTTMSPETDSSTPGSKQLSFYYYSLFGLLITLIVSNITSFIIERDDKTPIAPKLLAPMVRNLFSNYSKGETGTALSTFNEANKKIISSNE